MAIFPNLELDDDAQYLDKVRIRGGKSFISVDEAAITLVEIDPGDGTGFIDVTSTKEKSEIYFLDWEYADPGGGSQDFTAKVRITTDGAPQSISKDISLLTSDDDYLFSDDQALRVEEDEILRYVPTGRNTFKYLHRRVQEMILEDLYRVGITDNVGVKLTKEAIIDIDEVKLWSRYWVLSLIYKDNNNKNADIFRTKEDFYFNQKSLWSNKAIFKLDTTGDGTANTALDLGIVRIRRR